MTSIINLDATYTISHEFDDITLIARGIIRKDGRFVHSFPDREAAEYFARMHASLCK